MQIGAAEPFRLSDGGEADDVNPAWSPDGARIAFLRRHDPERFDVMVMSSLGGIANRVYEGQMFSISVDGSPPCMDAGGRPLAVYDAPVCC